MLSTEKVKQQLAPQHLNVPAIENGNLTEKRWSLLDTLINPLINPLSLLYGSGFSIFAFFSARSAFAREPKRRTEKLQKCLLLQLKPSFARRCFVCARLFSSSLTYKTAMTTEFLQKTNSQTPKTDRNTLRTSRAHGRSEWAARSSSCHHYTRVIASF